MGRMEAGRRWALGVFLTAAIALAASTALAAPPAVWSPVLAHGHRSGVYIFPPGLTQDRPQAIEVRVENRNPFPVEVTALSVRPTDGRDVFTGAEITLAPRAARTVILHHVPDARQTDRVEFRLGVWRTELDGMGPLHRVHALWRAATVLETEARNDGDVAWSAALADEAQRVGGQLSTLRAELCAGQKLAWDRVPDDVEAALDAHGAFRVRARDQPEMLSCLTADHDSRIAVAALRAERANLAEWVAVRHDAGADTPEPFKWILAQAIRRALTDQIAEARKPWPLPSSRLHQWELAVQLLERLRVYAPDDSYMHPAHPDQPLRAVEEMTRQFAVDNDFADADHGLVILRLQVAEGWFAAERVEALQGAVEYERGVHLYNFRRGVTGAHGRAVAAFDIATPHYPVRARLWKVALVVADNQFLLVMGLFLLGLIGVFGGRTEAWTRFVARSGLRAAGRLGPTQAAVDRVWDAVTRAATLRPTRRNDRFRARLGDAILRRWSTVDPRLAAEAGQLVAAARADVRGPEWASPAATLRAVLASGVDDATVARAAAVWGDDPCVDALRAIRRADAEALVVAVAAIDDADLRNQARFACGVRMAALGPRAQDPSRFWRRAWELLRDATPGQVSDGVRRAATFAAACAGDTADAVRWIDAAPARCPLRRSAALMAARNAVLPVPSQRALAVPSLVRLGEILSGWDTREALDARLRVAVLERLAVGAGSIPDPPVPRIGASAFDTANLGRAADGHSRAVALLATAAGQRHPVTVGLASALDLLTDGNHGFDDQAQQVLGARWALLQALDALSQGDLPTAAALLAGADPDAPGTELETAVRIECARAIAAHAMGRPRACVDALGSALGRATVGVDQAAMEPAIRADPGARANAATVRAVCAALAPGLLSVSGLGPEMVRNIARGCLDATGHSPWNLLARRLMEHGDDEIAAEVLRRAARDNHPDRSDRAALWTALAASASRRGDCGLARACVILARGSGDDFGLTPSITG